MLYILLNTHSKIYYLIIYVSNVYEKIVAPKKILCYKNVLKISQAKNTILDAFKDKSSYWVKFVLSGIKLDHSE